MGIIVRITEAEAVRDISALLERVRTQGVSGEILRGDEVVARLEPAPEPKRKTMASLISAMSQLPPLSEEDSTAWELDLADIRKSMPMQIREWD